MYVGGLDIGTTGCKIVLYDEKGSFIDKFYKEYDVSRSKGLHEIDLLGIWNSVKSLLREASKYKGIKAIGVTSFGETFAMLDKEDNILAPSMLYTDPRGEAECKILVDTLGAENIAKMCGVMPHFMYSLPKLMWIKNNMPKAFEKADKVLLVQDYIVYMLTGKRQIDYALACRTMGFDILNKCWNKEVFNAAGIDISLMSQAVESGTTAGQMKDSIARETGIDKDAVIVTGSHDQIAAITGAGIFDSSVAMDGSGTVECVPVILDKVPENAELYSYGYSVVPHINGKYACYVLSYVGGAALKWYRDTFAVHESRKAEEEGKNIYAVLDSKVKDEPGDILVLPHFAGAATPYMDTNSKAAFVGLTFEHDLSDIYKALMEGVAYEIKINFETLQRFEISPKKLRASGGGAHSDVWLQIKSDILGIPITALSLDEVGAAGTAILAGVSCGIFDDVEKYTKIIAPERKTFTPNRDKNETYEGNMRKYRKLYTAVKSLEV
ncbi:MAG: FGGY-family carbohydrate kinase [Bacillota bacterium]|nr:FGGY-family carbohydrate kinase [Bacillota bacterium]